MTTIPNSTSGVPFMQPGSGSQIETIIKQIEAQAALGRTGTDFQSNLIATQSEFTKAQASFNSKRGEFEQKITKETDPKRKAELQNILAAGEQKLAKLSDKLKGLIEKETERVTTASRLDQEISGVLGNFNNQTIAGMSQLLSMPSSSPLDFGFGRAN
jgi:hypothetical protein